MPLPTIVEEYVRAAMKRASYERIDDSVAATVPGAFGVIAFGATEEGCTDDLRARLIDWVAGSLAEGERLPVFGDIDLAACGRQSLSGCFPQHAPEAGRMFLANEQELFAALDELDREG